MQNQECWVGLGRVGAGVLFWGFLNNLRGGCDLFAGQLKGKGINNGRADFQRGPDYDSRRQLSQGRRRQAANQRNLSHHTRLKRP